MGKQEDYVVESDFDDLHGDPAEAPDLELNLSDEDNPIIQAALNGDDTEWEPPAKDDEGPSEDEDDDELEDATSDTDDDDDESELDDDSSADDGEEEDEEDESDDEKYSKSVQKRIDRERELRRRDKEDADRRIAKLENREKLRDAESEFSKAEQEASSKLKKLKQRKVDALEEGETAKVVDIDDEILDIKADLKAQQIELKRTKAEIESNNDSTTGSDNTPAAGKKFLEKYPEFHTNKQFREVLLLTDRSVAARGLDKNTEEYYAEIERILKPQFPKIVKTVKVAKKRKRKVRSAVGGTTQAGTRRSNRKPSRRGRIRLTKEDQANMEIFGLDPTNKVDALAWAKGKGA